MSSKLYGNRWDLLGVLLSNGFVVRILEMVGDNFAEFATNEYIGHLFTARHVYW